MSYPHSFPPIIFESEKSFELIETMRQETNGKIIRLEKHLQRLEFSANKLGFFYRKKDIETILEKKRPSGKSPLRLRLTLQKDGEVALSYQSFIPYPKNKKWIIRIASKTNIVSNDTLLQYKTGRRDIFNKARNEFTEDEADEVILINEKNQICEGTRTSLFLRKKKGEPLLTPALCCGLLRGLLRQDMLDTGKAKEEIISLEMFKEAKEIFVGNTLHGLFEAVLKS